MGKMKPVANCEEFLEGLAKSRLLSADQVAGGAKTVAAGIDPAVLAKQLMKDRLLTKWQAAQILAGFFSLTYGKYRLNDQLSRDAVCRRYLADQGIDGKTDPGPEVRLIVPLAKHLQNSAFVGKF